LKDVVSALGVSAEESLADGEGEKINEGAVQVKKFEKGRGG